MVERAASMAHFATIEELQEVNETGWRRGRPPAGVRPVTKRLASRRGVMAGCGVMMTPIRIRRAVAGDGDAVAALESGPYRPEDQPEVAAMRRRAERARRAGRRWSSAPDPTVAGDPQGPIDRYNQVWLAERVDPTAAAQVVGVVAARTVGDTSSADVDTAEASGFWPLSASHPLVELRHLRVAHWMRRAGVGGRLVQQVIDHATHVGAAAVVLNTTAAQHPARALYARYGFRETGVTYLGEYELVWMEHPLRD